MTEYFNISQEETGFPLVKKGNFASFAPINKRCFLRDSHAHALREHPTSSTGKTVGLFERSKICTEPFTGHHREMHAG